MIAGGAHFQAGVVGVVEAVVGVDLVGPRWVEGRERAQAQDAADGPVGMGGVEIGEAGAKTVNVEPGTAIRIVAQK
ncbi:hypothetical protein [Streptomyces griseocarneus]|uniref:hypothetical protein n=1 Tax=Streptomyces griseocarneus TaxID=51201 RepID=UPI001CCC3969|nr:hypothetical protein [Streptomyces griseocarneus]